MPNNDNIEFIPYNRAPADGDTVLINRWWVTHPQKGLAVWRNTSPQCNTERFIVERLSNTYDWAEVKFVQIAYLPASMGHRRAAG